MKKIITIIVLVVFYISGHSQTDEIAQMKNWELLGYAKSAERINDSYSAIDYYSEYYKRNENKDDISFKLANLYFEVKDFQKAKPIYYKLYKKNQKNYPNSLFKYGQILKYEELYDSAISCFETFRTNLLNLGGEAKNNFYLLMASREIEGCKFAEVNKKKNKNIHIKHLNSTINKAYKEADPIIWNDTVLIYSSYMIDSLPIIKIDQKSNLPVEKFYSAKLINNTWQGGFAPPEPFFNFDSLSTSNAVYSDDYSRLYFTAGKANIEGKKINSIYVSKFENGAWQMPEKLSPKINLRNYTTTQPTIGKCYNKDYDVIYFVSDRPGGFGAMDIWYTIYDKKTKTYKSPINAGSYINTPGNEITPYYDKSSKSLYFSSDGLKGFGGYDIYKTIGELVNWIPAINIGFPINSPYDDFYYTKFKKDTIGFFVSNRSESKILKNPNCCYDIFQYYIENKIDFNITGKIFETNKLFYDNLLNSSKKKNELINNNKKATDAIVELHIENKNNGKYIFIKSDTTNTDGIYNFNIEENQNYKLEVIKENFTPTEIKFNTNNNSKDHLFVLEPVTIIPIQEKAVSLNNIYFEFNKWDLNAESKAYIDESLLVLMKKHKNIVIEISAYTDGLGDSDYNLVLSKNRAVSVVNYLTSKGINKDRIIAKGYGEANKIASEVTNNGDDNPEGRAKNRRIEFRVVGMLMENNLIKNM